MRCDRIAFGLKRIHVQSLLWYGPKLVYLTLVAFVSPHIPHAMLSFKTTHQLKKQYSKYLYTLHPDLTIVNILPHLHSLSTHTCAHAYIFFSTDTQTPLNTLPLISQEQGHSLTYSYALWYLFTNQISSWHLFLTPSNEKFWIFLYAHAVKYCLFSSFARNQQMPSLLCMFTSSV